MPGMIGSDLAQRMLQIRPEIPIILCTGYSDSIDENSAKNLGIKEFVSNIYTEFLKFDFRNSELRKKSDSIKWNLKKKNFQLASSTKVLKKLLLKKTWSSMEKIRHLFPFGQWIGIVGYQNSS